MLDLLVLLLLLLLSPVLVLGSMAPSSYMSSEIDSSEEYNGTFAPTMRSLDDVKLHSYFCLEKQQSLCIGISTDGDPSYNAESPYFLQIKRREKNEEKGTDYQKMRWAVDRVNGRIQLSNFTSLCAARQFDNNQMPGPVVLRPCGTVGKLEKWNLKRFLDDITEEGTISLNIYPNQCLSLMECNRTPLGFCDPTMETIYPHGSPLDVDLLRGSFLRMMPCSRTKHNSQTWRQRLDCSPGCSPFMTQDRVCDAACNTQACNWDNNACATKKPTPPTRAPTRAPTKSPTTSLPTASPTRSPSHTPTRLPTRSPTTSLPTSAPSFSKPTSSPTFSTPTSSPISSRPTSSPTKSPSTSAPSFTPTTSPSFTPTTSLPTLSPSRGPTTSLPTRSPVILASQLVSETELWSLWWIWIIVGIVALFCCLFAVAGVVFALRRRRRRRRHQSEQEDGNAKRIKELDATKDEIEVADEVAPDYLHLEAGDGKSSRREEDLALL